MDKNNPLQIAHRGYSQYFKDNSIKAITEAIKNDFDMVEIDIQVCSTGEIVLYHDIIINEKFIKNTSLQELQQKNDIVLLDDVFKLLSNHKHIKLYLDLKGQYEFLITLLTQKIIEYEHKIDISNIYIASFNNKHIKTLISGKKTYNLPYNLGFITTNIFTEIDLIPLLRDVDFISCNWEMCNYEMVRYCKSVNKKIFVYTYKKQNKSILKYIMALNIDGIVSNCKINYDILYTDKK